MTQIPESGGRIYRGHPPHEVFIDDGGEQLLPLPHHVLHSPTGFSWGYYGSGPAELARCLVINALGDDAWCAHCRGTGLDGSPDGARCMSCWGDPVSARVQNTYQDVKRRLVARWPSEQYWTLARADLLDLIHRIERDRASRSLGTTRTR